MRPTPRHRRLRFYIDQYVVIAMMDRVSVCRTCLDLIHIAVCYLIAYRVRPKDGQALPRPLVSLDTSGHRELARKFREILRKIVILRDKFMSQEPNVPCYAAAARKKREQGGCQEAYIMHCKRQTCETRRQETEEMELKEAGRWLALFVTSLSLSTTPSLLTLIPPVAL
jgi:hypothetical protein